MGIKPYDAEKYALMTENKRLREALEQSLMAILYTRDYVDGGGTLLPESKGWSWYDAAMIISELMPDSAAVHQFKIRLKGDDS